MKATPAAQRNLRNRLWKHSKYKTLYTGHYIYVKKGALVERVFMLRGVKGNGHQHNISFESHEAAKKIGWTSI